MHITWAGKMYRFDGWFFEAHEWHGPYPLNKNGDPRLTPPGRKFFRMWDKFMTLPESERRKYIVWETPK